MIDQDQLGAALSTIKKLINDGNVVQAKKQFRELLEQIPPDSPFYGVITGLAASLEKVQCGPLFREYVIDCNLGDIQFKFLIGDSVGESWFKNMPADIPQITFTRSRMVKRTDSIFEVGAHHGYFTMMLAKWADLGRVVAFEALPHNSVVLSRNVSLNSLTNVEVVNKAVSNTEGTCLIRQSPNSCVSLPGETGIESPVTYLDKYAHLDPTFLKIDVEGLEVQVLRGAKTILEKRPKLMVEVHLAEMRSYGYASNDLLEILKPLDYSVWLEVSHHAPVPYDWSPLDGITEGGIQLYALPN